MIPDRSSSGAANVSGTPQLPSVASATRAVNNNPPLSANPSSGDIAVLSIVAVEAIKEVARHIEKAQLFASKMEKSFENMERSVAAMSKSHTIVAQQAAATVKSVTGVGHGPATTVARSKVKKSVDPMRNDPAAGESRPEAHEFLAAHIPVTSHLTPLQQVRNNATARANQWLSERSAAHGAAPAMGTAERAAWEKSQSRIGRAIGAVNSFGEGEGLMGAAKIGLGRFAGPIGVGLTAVNWGINQLSSQRSQNAFYQQITGDSNASGFAQRAHENTFAWSQKFSGMGERDARELFKGVTTLDPTGNSRQAALDFATSEYKNLGVSVQDSLALISESIHAGVKDFGVMKEALDSVSASARAGGLNVLEQQHKFAAAVGAAAPQYGAGATAIAKTLTATLARTGMQNLAGLDLSGFASDSSMQALAARSGLKGGTQEFMEKVKADPSYFGGSVQSAIQEIARTQLGSQGMKRVSELTAQYSTMNNKGQRVISPENQQKIVDQATSEGINYNPQAVVAQLSGQYGLNVSDDQAGSLLFGVAGGTVNFSATSQEGKLTDAGAKDDLNSILHSMGYPPFSAMTMPPKEVIDYLRKVKDTKKRDPVLEKALSKNLFDPKRRFGVQTADGQRNVGMSDIIQHYSDQFAQGSVVTLDAKGNPTAVTSSQLTGGMVDSTRKLSDGTSSVDQAGKYGKNIDGSNATGAVIINMDPTIRQWFGIQVSGNAMDGNKRTGTVGPAVITDPNSLPNANGGSPGGGFSP